MYPFINLICFLIQFLLIRSVSHLFVLTLKGWTSNKMFWCPPKRLTSRCSTSRSTSLANSREFHLLNLNSGDSEHLFNNRLVRDSLLIPVQNGWRWSQNTKRENKNSSYFVVSIAFEFELQTVRDEFCHLFTFCQIGFKFLNSTMNSKEISSLLVARKEDISKKIKNVIGIIHLHHCLSRGIKWKKKKKEYKYFLYWLVFF